MSFNPNIPQANDDLSDSQGDLLLNFQTSNASFGVDHYPFADLTANNGFHNKVTTPAFIDSPPSGLPPVTAAAIPKFYAYEEPTSNVGVIQYSRGPSNAVPSPVTHLQSTATPIIIAPAGTTNVLDFSNLTRAFCLLYAADMGSVSTTRTLTYVIWNGTTLTLNVISTGAPTLNAQVSGAVLRLVNSGAVLNDVYWTLDMLRIS